MGTKRRFPRKPGSPTRLIVLDGEERTLLEWSRIYGVKHNTILERIARGWSWERAIIKKPAMNGRRGPRNVVSADNLGDEDGESAVAG